MKIFMEIIGVILALPIAVVIVGLIITTLLGGYIYAILKLAGELIIIVLLIILLIKIVLNLINKKG